MVAPLLELFSFRRIDLLSAVASVTGVIDPSHGNNAGTKHGIRADLSRRLVLSRPACNWRSRERSRTESCDSQ